MHIFYYTISMHEARYDLFFVCVDGKQQVNFVWSGVPFGQPKPTENFTWEGTCASKSIQTKGHVLKPSKFGGTDGLPHLQGHQVPNPVQAHNSNEFFLSKDKGTPVEILDQGLFFSH